MLLLRKNLPIVSLPGETQICDESVLGHIFALAQLQAEVNDPISSYYELLRLPIDYIHKIMSKSPTRLASWFATGIYLNIFTQHWNTLV